MENCLGKGRDLLGGEVRTQWWTIPFLLLSLIGSVRAAALPDNMIFVGLSGNEWSAYRVLQQKLQPLPALKNVHNITFSPLRGKITFVDSDVSLQTSSLDTRKSSPAVDDPENRYTQPKYGADGKHLFSVMLKQGQSRSTEIVEFVDGEAPPRKVMVKRIAAQFDPYMVDDRYLYYTTALCVDGCGKMIWEL